jgi:hypothetical protein
VVFPEFSLQFFWNKGKFLKDGTTMKSAILTILLLASTCLGAQNFSNLSQFFEGKQVIVKIDMPGSQQGIDIYPQKGNQMDAKSYGKRMKEFPVSIRNGDMVMVTTVKVKDKSIEFQLARGGFGTFGDDTDTRVKFTPADKSDREKDLERQIANTNDSYQKDRLQRELDYLRHQRERAYSRNRAIAEHVAQEKQYQVNENRARGGSRFNLKYDGKVPADISPQDVMTALTQYVSFSPLLTGGAPSAEAPSMAATPAPGPAAAYRTGGPASSLQKGMAEEQVRALLGAPTNSSDADHDGIQVHSETYTQGNSVVTAQFVNGVLVKYSIEVH